MKLLHFEKLKPLCPRCLRVSGQHFPLTVGAWLRGAHNDMMEGILLCSNPQCLSEYPVIDGIPLILADLRAYISQNILSIVMRDDLSESIESLIGDCCATSSPFYIRRHHLSTYVYDHYADKDPAEQKNAFVSSGSVLKLLYQGLSQIPKRADGPVIDMGCSVGRTAFELARTAEDIVLGVDMNFAMLRLASHALRNGKISYPRKRTGLVFDRREFPLCFEGSEKVDFWACDICALPFADQSFGLALCLNTLDCVHLPYDHMRETERILKSGGKAIFSTPYDWSESATPLESWIGGHSQRSGSRGACEAMLRTLLSKGEENHSHQLKNLRIVSEINDVPWSVRIHERSVMQYALHMLILEKTGIISKVP